MNDNWFESRGLKVLKYQDDAISKVQLSMEEREITVLAAAPSAGKTLMTTYIIEEYLKQNSNHKVLVLAHGTTVLRTQFHDVLKEIKPDFTYNLVEKFTQYDLTTDVNVCLPQTLAGNILSKIDLLIVDEAHQFYFAEKMMKEIIKQTKPKKQLLLTGTPSPFIRKGFKIIPVTLNTIFDEGMVSDLYVEIATSSYTFDPMHDFNQNDELKTDVYIKNSETKKTLDELVNKIVDKLKGIRGNEYQNLLPEWLPTLKRLQKTMIACRSQQQAIQVKHYFDKIGIKSALSISDIDYDSKEIQRFKDEEDCLILIVVGRGILGFNYPELVNIVDMTTSQNVDRIYQLLCRVIRKHPEGHKKLFFKVAPNIHSDYYKHIMTAVLSLADESFFTKFNGKNFSDMIIPVIKRRQTHGENNNNTKMNKSRPKTMKPIDFEGLPVFEFFNNLYHKKDALLHVYAQTTIMDVRAEFMDVNPNRYWTKERCFNNAQNYSKPQEWKRKNGGAYAASIRNGCYYDCIAHMEKNIKWTKNLCLESALSYNNINDWRENYSSAYNKAYKNNWLDECVAHMDLKRRRFNLTKEMCIEEARKHKTAKEWKLNDSTTFNAAQNNKWYLECTAHMKKPNSWTKEMCIEEARKHKTIKEWRNCENASQQIARKNGWYDECIKNLEREQKPNNYWNKNTCLKSAQNFNYLSDWQSNEGGAVSAARKNGWFKECTKHMKRPPNPNKKWDKNKCMISALKYNTKTEWLEGDCSAHSAARKNGWFKECTKHMNIIWERKWNKMACIEDARKYERKIDWLKNNESAYTSARRNGWLDECTVHMKKK